MKSLQIIGITPLEIPDARLALHLSTSGFFPVLHLGREEERAVAALKELAEKMQEPFGVCFVSPFTRAIDLPAQVGVVIVPYGMKLTLPPGARVFYQVGTAEQAFRAKEEGADGLIIKGNEGAGWVSDESSFILLQGIVGKLADIEIWVQGGVGIHSAAAMAALGVDGIVLDSQLIPFSECSAPAEIKNLCLSLNGSETKVIDNRRVLSRANFPVLPLGQDVALGGALVSRYKKLHRLAFAIREAVYGHLKQAKALPPIRPGNALAKELNVHYPIAQGPMTRVSDVPAFADAVAEAGALPFIALSLLRGEKARQVMQETRRLAGGKTWGVGILGFIPQELRDEQLTYILEEKPPVVLIAGGRPSQAKALEEQGIKVFLHVPSVALLDMFIRDGARRFVFEGRECGGHVGPLSSLVLWERQIDRLLQEESAESFSVLFAGGIHDAFSAAFVGFMAAPLATKGAGIGVLMGTAYLYTEEAVSTGAIVRQFQEQAI
ncbi:MAG TPA: nitronate monooxygenase, partial [Puia sp.]|nr:nitronate monooxygenase [Puia sp.]